MLRLDGHLVEEAGGRPLQGLNVRGFVHGADGTLMSLWHGTTDEDGSFSLEGRSDASPMGTSLRLHFEVLDGNLDLVHRTDQEVFLEEPDSLASITISVPHAPTPDTEDTDSPSEDKVAGLRVVPEDMTVALGSRVVLLAEAQDGDGVPVGGVRIGWQAQNADGQDMPISSSGEFVGHMPGAYEVTASGGGQEGTATVTVRDVEVGPAFAAPVAAALATDDWDVDLRWNDANAASAFAPTNWVGQPAAARLGAMPDLPWLGVRRDELPWLPETVTVGSANYTFSAPILRLEGRGMDLRLDLTYNSRLWSRTDDQVAFDIDQGWPAPGWSLGFGKVVRIGSQGSMFVDADGTRHPYNVVDLKTAGERWEFTGRTTDGTLIDYSHTDDTSGGFQGAQARYPDGRTVEYTARGHDYRQPVTGNIRPSWGVLFPTRITDANGNVIVITYRNNVGPEIEKIMDTMGRTVSFHYDQYGHLTGMTGPGLNGAQRTLVRLDIVLMRLPEKLEDAFSGLEAVTRTKTPRALRAIYYPATYSGYWFWEAGTYSAYGMISKVTRHRGMGFNGAPLTEAGKITPGTLTHQRAYNYPLVADPTLSDVPTYTSMTEIWEGMDTPPAVTRFAIQPEGNPRSTEVIYPNGTRTVILAYNRPEQFDDGLPYQQAIYDGSRLLQLTLNYWQQGDYASPRLWRVETRRERSMMTATEYDYGPYNRVTEMRELISEGTDVLRRTRTEYEPNPGYVRRHIFSLPTVVEVFDRWETLPAARTEYVYDGQPLRNTPGVVGHAQTHNPYAPRVVIDPYDEKQCDYDRQPPFCITIHHEGYTVTEYDDWTRFRGNPTEIRRYADPAQRREPVIERRNYDITGNLVLAETGRFDRSVYEYSLDTQYAYPARHVLGPAQPISSQISTSASYDFGTGLIVSVTDANGRTVHTTYEPTTLRHRSVKWPTGATTSIDYNEQQLPVYEATHAADRQMAWQRRTEYNGLGLVRKVSTLAGMSDDGLEPLFDITESRYDVLGRLWAHTRPYRTGATPFWTEAFRDALGRVTRTRAADGSETYAYYDEQAFPDVVADLMPAARGQTARLVDAWGRERWMCQDALGRLQFVVEPDPDSGGSVFNPGMTLTRYIYGALDQVVRIMQHGRLNLQPHRVFRYDGLGRLTRQYLAGRSGTLNQEAEYRQGSLPWSDAFAYADESRLAWHMDARGVRTIFDYGDDPLGRLQRITYQPTLLPGRPDVPPPPAPASDVRYEYVTSGDLNRLLRVTTDDLVEEYGYDNQGRLASKKLIVPDQPQLRFALDYGYDSLDRLRSLTYPPQYATEGASRKRVELEYDLASRPRLLTVDGLEQASDITYAPCGLTAGVTVGARSPQPVTEVYDCDPTNGLSAGQRVLRDGETLLDLSYDYQRPDFSGITGQLVRATDNRDTRRSTNYDYDLLGRLRQASGGNPDTPLWSQRYSYDRYGNRTDVAASGADPDGNPIPQDGIAGLTFSIPRPDGLSRTDNRLTTPGYAYDEAGNLTRSLRPDGTWQRYQYDAAGRLVSVTDDAGTPLETYTYGADRRRIRTRDAGTGAQRHYVWHGGNVIAEYDAEYEQSGELLFKRWRWSRTLVYLGQRLLCSYTPVDKIRRPPAPVEVLRYHHPDRLGTRLITTPESGEVMELVTLPYGTLLSPRRVTLRTPTFTSYDRSPVTGLDYAVNRYYDPQQGRFTQGDPLELASITPADLKSLNLYAYVRNDPVNATDPSGLRWINVWRGGTDMYQGGRWIGSAPHHIVDSYWVPDDPDEFAREELRSERARQREYERGRDADVEVYAAGLFGLRPQALKLTLDLIKSLLGGPMQQIPKPPIPIPPVPPAIVGGRPPVQPPDPEGIFLKGPLQIFVGIREIMRSMCEEDPSLCTTEEDRRRRSPYI
jgi:RHS repeat-associated protein